MDLIYKLICTVISGICGSVPLSADGLRSVVDHFLITSTKPDPYAMLFVIAGTGAAFLARYWRRVSAAAAGSFRMLSGICGKGFNYSEESTPQQRDAVMSLMSLVPTASVLLIGERMTVTAVDRDIIVEGICFLFCGVLLAAACRNPAGDKSDGTVTFGHSLIIGAASVLGIYPGISALSAGLSAALLLGYEPGYALRRTLMPSLTVSLFAVLARIMTTAQFIPDAAMSAITAALSAAAGFGAIWLTGWLLKKERLSLFAYLSIVLGLITVILGTVETASGMSIAELIAAMKG